MPESKLSFGTMAPPWYATTGSLIPEDFVEIYNQLANIKIVNRVRMSYIYNDAPKAYGISVLADKSASDGKSEAWGSACDIDPRRMVHRAFGELVERLFTSKYKLDELQVAGVAGA